jgi:hypothetical protein
MGRSASARRNDIIRESCECHVMHRPRTGPFACGFAPRISRRRPIQRWSSQKPGASRDCGGSASVRAMSLHRRKGRSDLPRSAPGSADTRAVPGNEQLSSIKPSRPLGPGTSRTVALANRAATSPKSCSTDRRTASCCSWVYSIRAEPHRPIETEGTLVIEVGVLLGVRPERILPNPKAS